jgi:DNA segregation ATPase FtsK/SpoIIIE, S-DNA-T family
MKLLSPTPHKRANELFGLLVLSLGLVLVLSLASYHAQDPSWNTSSSARPSNLIGYPGAWFSDLLLQAFGIGAFLLPGFLFGLAWKWLRSRDIEAGAIKLFGTVLLLLSLISAVSFAPHIMLFGGIVPLGGLLGVLLAHYLMHALNTTGAILLTVTTLIVSVYLVSTFRMSKLNDWLAGPMGYLQALAERWQAWRDERRRRKMERAERKRRTPEPGLELPSAPVESDAPPFEVVEDLPAQAQDIPICPLDEEPPPEPLPVPAAVGPFLVAKPTPASYTLPSTALLNEGQGRSPYDEQELKDVAVRIKSKFEEFNVLGSVVQINPGPVVTTFEFKPEAGIKYSRITALTEDLCLGLQAESILIERIPGKPTVGIEVPNTKRELIVLRQILESDEFHQSPSHLTISMGKDINGRIKVSAL